MSSFGRGRGILPIKLDIPSPVAGTKNGLSSDHIKSLPLNTLTNAKTVPTSLVPLTLVSRDSSTRPPNLHALGETLITLREEDSLFPIILDIINSPLCTVETVERMVQIIMDRCMWLPMISRKYASLLTFLSSHKVFGKQIRCLTLNMLQTFFEDRDSLRTSKKYGDDTFRNAVVLTGELYYRYRLPNSRYKVLGVAVLSYLKTLVESVDEKDLHSLAQQLSWSGDEIVAIDENSMNKMFLDIHRKLTVYSSGYTETGRVYLLLCLELRFQPFDSFPEEVKTFYCDKLGEEIISSIKPPSLELDNHLEYYNSIRKFFL